MFLSLQNIQNYMKLLEYLDNCIFYIWYTFIQYCTVLNMCGRITNFRAALMRNLLRVRTWNSYAYWDEVFWSLAQGLILQSNDDL